MRQDGRHARWEGAEADAGSPYVSRLEGPIQSLRGSGGSGSEMFELFERGVGGSRILIGEPSWRDSSEVCKGTIQSMSWRAKSQPRGTAESSEVDDCG